jgi:hypothetical protein
MIELRNFVIYLPCEAWMKPWEKFEVEWWWKFSGPWVRDYFLAWSRRCIRKDLKCVKILSQ